MPKSSPEIELQTSSVSLVKKYNRTKLILGFGASGISFIVGVVFVAFGFSRALRDAAYTITSHDYVALIVFLLAFGFLEGIVSLPFGFYSGYVLEHAYNLSNQSLARWAWERIKGMLVSAPLLLVVVLVLFYCLRTYGNWWWLPVSCVLVFFSIVLARIVPTFIMPLFYTFTPIDSGSLRDRIERLCTTAGVHFDGIFAFNMSKNTRKANAGFTGIGKAKRIILGDTLINEFSEEEIETVFAHELGHYKHKHIVVGIIVGIISTVAGLIVASYVYARSLEWFGFASIADIAALPLLGVSLSIFGFVTSPLGNILSRKHEREADEYAVRTTKNIPAFVSALQKLSATNLADPEPHPWIEFFFHSHPSIAKRVAFVKSFEL